MRFARLSAKANLLANFSETELQSRVVGRKDRALLHATEAFFHLLLSIEKRKKRKHDILARYKVYHRVPFPCFPDNEGNGTRINIDNDIKVYLNPRSIIMQFLMA